MRLSLPGTLLRTAFLLLLSSSPALAQQRSFFAPNAVLPTGAQAPTGIRAYRLYETDLATLRTTSVAVAGTMARTGAAEPVALPMPDGSYQSFYLEPTQILSSSLAAENPDIRTYAGRSVDGRSKLALTLSAFGASAYIQTPEGGVYVTPLSPDKPHISVVARVRDYIMPEGGCGLGELDEPAVPTLDQAKATAFSIGDNNKRTYDLVVSTTGEYTTAAGGAVGALARVTATVATLNAIFQRDLGVTFILSSPVNLRYTSSATDPFSAGPGIASADLNANQTAVDAEVGSSGYDIGHVFGSQWSGGLAQLGSTCNSTGKARAASGSGNPVGAAFDAIVAHETGHQFNATHSFAASNGSCGSNISASTGWEPGGGSTLMAYTSVCTGNFYQVQSELYFHGGNLGQMSAFVLSTTTGGSCATTVTSGNTVPTASTTATAYTIPHSTPFRLTLTSTDADADTLTYTHEQIDAVGGSGTATAPLATATSGPNFRSFAPSSDSSRYLPNLLDLSDGTPTPYEVLPSVARTMNFRLLARDNNTGVGHVRGENVSVTTASSGPFSVTSGTSAAGFSANGTNTMTVTWSNAGTGTTCPNVNIRFSRDGGATYPYVVVSGTANDGSHTFTVPSLATCNGRYMVECGNNIFFNVNTSAQTVTSSCAAEGTLISPATPFTAVQGSPSLALTMSPQYGTAYTTPLTGSIASTDAATNLIIQSVPPAAAACNEYNGNPGHYKSFAIRPGTNGSYTFTRAAGSASNLILSLYDRPFNAFDPCSGLIASTATDDGTAFTIGSALTQSLCNTTTYYLVVTQIDAFTATPASYNIGVSGGSIYTHTVSPGAGFSYSYTIVNNATGNVVQVQSSPNLSSASTFPAGSYSIYGVSSTASAAILNMSYAGQPFTALTSALYNQTGGVCGMISSNLRSISITLALTADNIRFGASIIARRSARAAWTDLTPHHRANYAVERSYDGAAFEEVGRVKAQASGDSTSHAYEDGRIAEEATEVHYRLRAESASGAVTYTPSVRLPLAQATGRSLRVIPNPVISSTVGAELLLPQAGTYAVSVVDATGRTVWSAEQNLRAGMQTISLPAPALPAGVYTLRVAGAGEALNARFVKTR